MSNDLYFAIMEEIQAGTRDAIRNLEERGRLSRAEAKRWRGHLHEIQIVDIKEERTERSADD